MAEAEDVLSSKKVFALVGASQDQLKYSYEVLRTMVEAGYTVYPVNPRYEAIDDLRCYRALAEVPEKPEVAIISLAPANVEGVLDEVKNRGIELVWAPPGSWSEAVQDKCQRLGLELLHDVCPVAVLKKKKP
ncbi:MAG: CoA-binding protein [Candidatus Oleimicrobiaceae bacterium]